MRFRFAQLMLAATVFAAPAIASEITTDAEFRVRVLGTTIADIRLNGKTDDSRYAVNGELTTRGIASAFVDVRYVGQSDGRRADGRFLPRNYEETVIENGERRNGGLAFKKRIPHPYGFKEEERGKNALGIAGQGDTVDPLTGLFMVLRDQGPDEVCQIQQFAFDGERRTYFDFTNATPTEDGLVCEGVFRRVAGYPRDKDNGRRKVLNMTVRYQKSGDLYQVQDIRLMTDYGPATLRRK